MSKLIKISILLAILLSVSGNVFAAGGGVELEGTFKLFPAILLCQSAVFYYFLQVFYNSL